MDADAVEWWVPENRTGASSPSPQVPPALIYHYINCYETVEQYSIEGNLYSVAFFNFEAPVHDGPKSVNDLFLDNLRSPVKSYDTTRVLRYKLPIGFSTLPGLLQARLEITNRTLTSIDTYLLESFLKRRW